MKKSFSFGAVLAVVAFIGAVCALSAPAQSFDLYSGTALLPIQKPMSIAASATNADGAIRNVGYLGNAIVLLSATNTAGSTPTLDVKLQGSNDATNYADITGAAFTQVTTSNSVQAISLRIQEAPLYIRATNVIGGTSSPAYIYSVTILAPQKYK